MSQTVRADNLKGRVAIVTGAGQPPWRHFAEVLAAAGAAAVIAERNKHAGFALG